MTGPWYCSLDAVADAIDLGTATGDYDQIRAVLESVSRQVEQWTNHESFQPQVKTRRFTAEDPFSLRVTDLLSVTSIQTDTSGNRTFNTTMSATCYELEPYNNPSNNLPLPYWRVDLIPTSSGVFPTWPRQNGVQITGTWGFYDVEAQKATVSSAPLDATSTGFTAVNSSNVEIGNTIKIDDEQMFVNSVATTTTTGDTLGTITVDRAVNGTSGASHSSGTAINVYQYPIVERATLIQASRILARRRAPLGVIGSVDVGVIRLRDNLDPDVKQLLDPLTERVLE